jgi:hypothetical protein
MIARNLLIPVASILSLAFLAKADTLPVLRQHLKPMQALQSS